MSNLWLELFGYLGSTMVVVSMLMASVVRLRVINTIGSVISGTYALIIGSFPLALMNICLIIINLYNLYKLLKTKQQFEIIPSSGKDSFIRYFLTRYQQDILQFFPSFCAENTDTMVAYLVCCNGTPAGLLLGEAKEDGALNVLLDYSVPSYRDCSVGAYLYANLGAHGIQKLVFSQDLAAAHSSYLTKMGFENADGNYTKTIG